MAEEKVPCNKQYTKLAKLGKGAFGEVHKAKDEQNNRLVAIKQIDLKEFKSVATEISLLKKCDCRNVVRLLDEYKDNKYHYIVLNFMLCLLHQCHLMKKNDIIKVLY
eukprot:289111_1